MSDASSLIEGAESRARKLAQLEERLGYRFADHELLETALRHSSRAHEDGKLSNERLEFLGDAVLGMVVAQLLYEAHPDWAEGDLTRGLASLVGGRSLARVARDLELGLCLELGRTELRSGGVAKDTILENALEAVVGAMQLDGGSQGVEAFARRVFAAVLEPGAPRVGRDPKTELNELTITRTGDHPSYELVSDSGVDDDGLRFVVRVVVGGRICGEGAGRSKQTAQVAAARAALYAGIDLDG